METMHDSTIQRHVHNLFSIRSLIRLAMLAGVWLVMTEGIGGSWLVGLPVIILVVMFLSDEQTDGHRPSISMAGAAAYLPFFLRQSVRSGFDVALRAFRPDMGLQPGLLSYPLGLPAGPARHLFVNSITLMPGTLSVLVQGDTVLVHALDERMPVRLELARLETRVGAVFGIKPAATGRD
jgi:multicomponent Na+:H+ antiporter subunit E